MWHFQQSLLMSMVLNSYTSLCFTKLSWQILCSWMWENIPYTLLLKKHTKSLWCKTCFLRHSLGFWMCGNEPILSIHIILQSHQALPLEKILWNIWFNSLASTFYNTLSLGKWFKILAGFINTLPLYQNVLAFS